jgi:hypothetical protein
MKLHSTARPSPLAPRLFKADAPGVGARLPEHPGPRASDGYRRAYPRARRAPERRRAGRLRPWSWGTPAGSGPLCRWHFQLGEGHDYCRARREDDLPCAQGEPGADGRLCPYREHVLITRQEHEAWDVLLACQCQLRLAPNGHVIGFDMDAALTLTAARATTSPCSRSYCRRQRPPWSRRCVPARVILVGVFSTAFWASKFQGHRAAALALTNRRPIAAQLRTYPFLWPIRLWRLAERRRLRPARPTSPMET